MSRRWSVLLTCWILVLAQAGMALGMGRVSPAPKPCSCCSCGGWDCCVSDDPTPAAPQSEALPPVLDPLQPWLAVLSLGFGMAMAEPSADPHSRPVLSVPCPAAVPLHLRNCTFLI
jgi:hypothetical protein